MYPRATPVGPVHDAAGPMVICKAWVNFSGSAPTVLGSFNVASVTRGSAGVYTVTWAQAFADANYALAVMAMPTGAFDAYAFGNGTPTAASMEVDLRSSANTLADSDIICLAVWGRT
jgi:hypothetical protein